MAQHRVTRTIHQIRIDLNDDILAGIESGDEVEIVVQSREGESRAKKLSPMDVDVLTGNGAGWGRRK